MKRTITLLCCLLMLCLMLPASGLAETQEEWDLSCSSKTINSATVYDFSETEEGEEGKIIGRIPAGSYVRVHDTGVGDWKDVSYMVNGVKGRGVAEVKTVNCTSHVRMSDGYQHKIHEKDPQYEEKVQMGVLELEYDKTPVQTDSTTATIASSNATNTSGDSNDTSSPSTNDSSGNDAVSATNSKNESSNHSANSSSQPEVIQEEASLANEETEVRILELGTYQTTVELNGEDQTVLTADLTFSEAVPEEQKVAVIHTPRTGKATMRASASKNSDHVKTCKAGAVVSVLEVGSEFSLVNYNGSVGYVLNDCLEFHAPVTETQGNAKLSYKGKTNGSTTVNIRNLPEKDSAKAATWKTGTDLVVLSHADGWYEIEANGVRGFVMEEFVTFSD